MCCRIRRVANESLGAMLFPRHFRADRCGIGHHVSHIMTGTMPGIHCQKSGVRHISAHLIGVIGSDTGRPQLLQQDRFQIDQTMQRTGQIKQGLTRTDPVTFLIILLDVESRSPRLRHVFKPADSQTGGKDHRTPHEDGIGCRNIAKLRDSISRSAEILVGQARDIGFQRPVTAVMGRIKGHDSDNYPARATFAASRSR